MNPSILQANLIKFAKLFDPPLKVLKHKIKGSDHSFFCIYAQNGDQLSFDYYSNDKGNCSDGCFFTEMSSWNTWQEMFANGGTLYCVHEIEPWKKYTTIRYYVIPKFNSLEELKMKLAIIGPQFPEEIVNRFQ